MWTRFYDMRSGGGLKISPYNEIYIELPKVEAIKYFEEKFDRHPYNVTCECCGEDYVTYEDETFEESSQFSRKTYSRSEEIPVEEYVKLLTVLIISEKEINDRF